MWFKTKQKQDIQLDSIVFELKKKPNHKYIENLLFWNYVKKASNQKENK